MKKIDEIIALTSRLITSVRTEIGYLQVLEYELQDNSLVHVVQWHFNNHIEEDLLPKLYCETFYRDREQALQLALKVGTNLLSQF